MTPPTGVRAKWTWMIYLAGDNNLSTAGDVDLMEMRAVGSTPEVNIVAEFDNAGDRGTTRYHIQREGVAEYAEELGETDSGQPQTLLNFAAWATANYPADRYALILWNHGSGWAPQEMDHIARAAGSSQFNAREAVERSASPLHRVFFRSTLDRIFHLSSPAERAICSDDGSGHSLDTLELGRVLVALKRMLGRPLDLLGLDACLMSNLEVAYEIQQYVDCMVGSEETEPADGWPYTAVLGRLVAEPDLPTPELAAYVVREYVRSYRTREHQPPITQTALTPARAGEVAETLDSLADALVAALPGANQVIWSAQRRSARFYHNTLWDIRHFCSELERLTDAEPVRQAVRRVQQALSPGPDRFVLAEEHYGETVAQCGGVSVYFLPPLMEISRYYPELRFASHHRWLPMLRAYHEG